MAQPPRSAADWERIEIEYRAGIKSVREIAAEHSVSHTAINKRSKEQGWTRDLKAKIKAKADALVSKALVSREVSSSAVATEKLTVEVEAQVQARIRLAHRQDIAKSRTLAMKMLNELEFQSEQGDLYEKLADLLAKPEDPDASPAVASKRLDAFNQALALASRVKTMKDLADTLRILVALEREALGLDAKEGDAPTPKQLSDAERASRLATLLSRAQAATAEHASYH